MTRRCSRKAEEGFSLVEVLVALAVTGFITTALSGLAWSMRHLEARVQRENAAREALVSATRVFRSLVSGAVPDLREPSEGEPSGGTSRRVTLVSLGPTIMAFDRPRPVTLQTDRRGEATILRVRWDDPETGLAREEILLDGAHAISFSYFGKTRENVAPTWGDNWPDAVSLPVAVLLRVDLPALGPPIEIVVRTVGRLPHVCAALPHEERCRAGGNRAMD